MALSIAEAAILPLKAIKSENRSRFRYAVSEMCDSLCTIRPPIKNYVNYSSPASPIDEIRTLNINRNSTANCRHDNFQ